MTWVMDILHRMRCAIKNTIQSAAILGKLKIVIPAGNSIQKVYFFMRQAVE
jgi:hypothetical protein